MSWKKRTLYIPLFIHVILITVRNAVFETGAIVQIKPVDEGGCVGISMAFLIKVSWKF